MDAGQITVPDASDSDRPMNDTSEILGSLLETAANALADLWHRADAARRAGVGDAVHLRGLVEISNHCTRQCLYCGIRAANAHIQRYRMTADEILAAAKTADELGYGTVVLQSGEDPGLSTRFITDVVRRIKSETPLAVTLSLGERTFEEFALWRAAGADRYLMRFETSNSGLFAQIHPPLGTRAYSRVEALEELHRIGYEVGSGFLIGIPGQTYTDLANDLELVARLELDMIGVGPFVPHPETPLGRLDAGNEAARGVEQGRDLKAEDQVPNDELTTYKVLALLRILCPTTNIPSTTALATINDREGRELGLLRGANVIMPNVTPWEYRAKYEIYPKKACLNEMPGAFAQRLKRRIAELGRTVGTGPGASEHFRGRSQSGTDSRSESRSKTVGQPS